MKLNAKEILRKQHYETIGDHAAVQICRWTKKSLTDKGVCYKEKFYGIKSHRCCQMTPMILFENKCIHCLRAIELDFSDQIKNAKIMSQEEIIEKCVVAQKKLLSGFKGHNNINQKKFKESQDPNQFAISLFGEPTLYKEIGKFIENLRKKGKTSFLVTNGLNPDVISKMEKNNQLPTQLYVYVNSPNKELYDKFHRSIKKDAWKKLNKTLEIFKKIKNKTRTVIRINLVRGLNIEDKYIKEYASLIKKANPKFIEIKGYISV